MSGGIGPNGPHLRPEELVGALHDREIAVTVVHPEAPMGEPPPAWAGGLTIGASVTGYGPAADAIRAEVDADDAKDKLIARLRKQLADNQLTHAEYRQTALDLLASARDQRDDYMNDLAVKIRERDAARAEITRIGDLLTTTSLAKCDAMDERDQLRKVLERTREVLLRGGQQHGDIRNEAITIVCGELDRAERAGLEQT